MDDAADAAGDDPIVALEKRFRSRIVALKRQLEDRERRATNAKYVNEANEALHECRYALKFTYVYAFYLPQAHPSRTFANLLRD